MSHSMNRRRLMAGAAVAVPAAGLASLPALADAGADAGLLAMRGPLEEAKAAYDAAMDHFNALERRYSKVKPERPRPTPMPEAAGKAFDEMPVKMIGKMPDDHPYKVWQDEASKADAAAKDAWEAETDRLRAEIGVDAADDVVHQRLREMAAIVDAIHAMPAQSAAGMLFKIEAEEMIFPDDRDELFHVLKTDLEALAGERLS